MSNKINISFKNTTRDTKLFLTVKDREEQSDFIKNAIEFYLRYLEKNKPEGN